MVWRMLGVSLVSIDSGIVVVWRHWDVVVAYLGRFNRAASPVSKVREIFFFLNSK
jgi:hypothetical protein